MSDDERLRELYQRSIGSAKAGDCPAPEELLRLARRDGDENARLGILDHVMSCESCQRELDLVRAAERAGRGMQSAALTLHAGRNHRLRTFGTLLAAAAVLFAVGLTVRNARVGARAGVSSGAREVLRGSATADAAGAIRLISPSSDARASLPITLSWHAAPSAPSDGYRVEVLDSTGSTVVIEKAVRDTALVLPAGLLRAGDGYSWWVSGAGAGGSMRSRISAFRVAR